MSSSIVVGNSVLYTHVDDEGQGTWSGTVTNIFFQSDAWWASVTFDGVVVPPMKRCGIQGPLPWQNTTDINVNALTLRTDDAGDPEKRIAWQKKVRQYTDHQNAVADAQYVAEVQRFSHVEPGDGVTWTMNAGAFDNNGEFDRNGPRVNRPFSGKIHRICKNGLEAYVTGFDLTSTDPTKPHTFRLGMTRLTFI